MDKHWLFDMKVHGTKDVDGFTVLRVFGGWIYQFNCPAEEGSSYGVFVPEELNVNAKMIDKYV